MCVKFVSDTALHILRDSLAIYEIKKLINHINHYKTTKRLFLFGSGGVVEIQDKQLRVVMVLDVFIMGQNILVMLSSLFRIIINKLRVMLMSVLILVNNLF